MGADKHFYCSLYQVGDSLFLFGYGSLDTDSLNDDSTNNNRSSDPSMYFGKNRFKLHLNNDSSVACERYHNYDVSDLDLPADGTTVTFESNDTYHSGSKYLSFNFYQGSSDKVIVYVENDYNSDDTIAFVTKTESYSLSDLGLSTDDDGNYDSYTYHWKETENGSDKDEQHFVFSAQDIDSSADYDDMIDLVEDYFGKSDDWDTIKSMFSDAYNN